MRKRAMVQMLLRRRHLPRSYKRNPLSTFTKQSFVPAIMCDAYKRKIGDEGELVDGTQSGKGTIFPVQQFYRLPSCYSPNRFPQAYVIVVPLPCYLPACNSPEDTHGSNGTIGMKGTASYKELKSLFDEPTMPSWEEFVSGLDAQAPPSSEECASDFEEMVNKGTELAREIIMDP